LLLSGGLSRSLARRYSLMDHVDPSTPISRYLDLSKLAAMFYEGGLFFSIYDHLGDPHEGTLGVADMRDATREASLTYPGLAEREAFLKWIDEVWATRLRSVAINCWYLGTVESHAMWRLYGATVALESTVGEVLSAFQGPPIISGRVTYQEYEGRPSTGLAPLEVLSFKRSCFEHEREIRFFRELDSTEQAAITRLTLPFTRVRDLRTRGVLAYRDGIVVMADWKRIVKRVRLAPSCDRALRYAVVHLLNQEGIFARTIDAKRHRPGTIRRANG
jgi:hypothetical protein